MAEDCTVYKTVNVISKKWMFLIILSIYKSEGCCKRYSAIKKELAEITPKILSKRLKELENNDIIRREVNTSTAPMKTWYYLTDSGKDLVQIIQKIKSWGLKWMADNPSCENTSCKNCTLSPASNP